MKKIVIIISTVLLFFLVVISAIFLREKVFTKELINEPKETTPNYHQDKNKIQINNKIFLQGQKLEITFGTYKVDKKNNLVKVDKSKIQKYNPLEIKSDNQNEIIFLSNEQILSVNLKDPYLIDLINRGVKKINSGQDVYNYSKEIFSSLNLEKYHYWEKMEKAVKEKKPISLSELAKNKVGVCLEQSIFRILSFVYSNQEEKYKMVVLAPSQGSNDLGHATVKKINDPEEKIINDFIETGLYSWQINYIETINFKKID